MFIAAPGTMETAQMPNRGSIHTAEYYAALRKVKINAIHSNMDGISTVREVHAKKQTHNYLS